jgi:hypothetical protein
LGKNAETIAGRALMPRLLALAAVLALLLAGCGGSGEEAPALAQPADPGYAKRADAICTRAVAETRRLGRQIAQANPATSDPLTLTTELLIAPGLRIRERLADRLRALPEPQRGEASVAAYVELFDPLEALTRQRLQAGREGDLDEARRFEELMQELAEEQRAAAEQAGLRACAADFVSAAFAPGARP